MSYLIQTRVASSPYLILRVAACAAEEGIPDPRYWSQENIIHLAANPEWVQAFAGSSEEDPGGDEGAITDAMILTAVQGRFSREVEGE